MSKYAHLQVFCKLQKPRANYLSAFARRRSGVRIPSAPLLKLVDLQVKRETTMIARDASVAFVQQPCSNAEGSPQRPLSVASLISGQMALLKYALALSETDAESTPRSN